MATAPKVKRHVHLIAKNGKRMCEQNRYAHMPSWMREKRERLSPWRSKSADPVIDITPKQAMAGKEYTCPRCQRVWWNEKD